MVRGFELAKLYCQSCHLFPEPDLLDKRTWREQTLPRMAVRLGLMPALLERHPEFALLKATGVFPEKPILPLEDWNVLTNYYVTTAPAEAIAQGGRDEIGVGLRHFRYEKPVGPKAVPATTLVSIWDEGGMIVVGDGQRKLLDVYSADGKFKTTTPVGNIPVWMGDGPMGHYLACIGSFLPSDRTLGDLRRLQPPGAGFGTSSLVLTNLPRVTHAAFGDLNGDGRPDFTLCIYGHTVGRFSWFEARPDGTFREHELINKPGSIRSEIKDFDGDGTPDIAVLVAQDTEAMWIYSNDGKGRFTPHLVFQKPPLFGHTYFESVDFNKDGKLELLVTNGDNGEYASPTKNYHGVRVYANTGDLKFKQVLFYPLNGAFKAIARDFDRDGDLDMAAISFFPDYKLSPEESFVYLENNGRFRFKAATFRECISGRWLTMDAGDLDGDGDQDIVLGSYIHGPSEVPEFLLHDWETVGAPFVILRNTLK